LKTDGLPSWDAATWNIGCSTAPTPHETSKGRAKQARVALHFFSCPFLFASPPCLLFYLFFLSVFQKVRAGTDRRPRPRPIRPVRHRRHCQPSSSLPTSSLPVLVVSHPLGRIQRRFVHDPACMCLRTRQVGAQTPSRVHDQSETYLHSLPSSCLRCLYVQEWSDLARKPGFVVTKTSDSSPTLGGFQRRGGDGFITRMTYKM